MLSLQENTADRSPPVFAPDGTAITSASRPANSRERCALSFPAQSSMQPNGRAGDVVQARVSEEIFLRVIFVLSCPLVEPQTASPAGTRTCRHLQLSRSD